MANPYFICELKADLSLDDCIDFLNSLTNNGTKQFRQLYVALPFSRLDEMEKKFSDSGILFGSNRMNSCDPGAFTENIAAKMIRDVKGHFSLIGAQDERALFKVSNEQFHDKLKKAKTSGLKAIVCFGSGEDDAALLEMVKNAGVFDTDPHPLLVYQIPFTHFKSYLPTRDELNDLHKKASQTVKKAFGSDAGKISLLIALPNDLVGFSQVLENMPFHGAFFSKSGIYPHAVHQEALTLFHVNSEEEEPDLPIVEEDTNIAGSEPKTRKTRIKSES